MKAIDEDDVCLKDMIQTFEMLYSGRIFIFQLLHLLQWRILIGLLVFGLLLRRRA